MTEVSKRLIPREEIDKLLSKLTNPRAVCQECAGKGDCIGVDACYPADYFHMVELKIMTPTQADIRRMVNS